VLSEVLDRVSYILDAYEDDCIIAINDPNFMSDCYVITYSGKGDLLEELSKYFSVKLFCVHRDFASFQTSFAKMRFALEGMDQNGKETGIGNLMLIPAWLDKCSIHEFPVYGMEFVMSRTSAFVKDLFATHGLGDLRGITMPSPNNPNPAKKSDYSSIANHLKFLEQRWKHFDNPAGIHQKIKISSTEYANALLQMQQTWQQ
jgi:hypothetical protein